MPSHDNVAHSDRALLKALKQGNLKQTLTALAAGANAHAHLENGDGAWHCLAHSTFKNGPGPLSLTQERIATLLLEQGVAWDEPNEEGLSPLAIAVGRSHERLAERLLKLGANPNVLGRENMHLLAIAAQMVIPETVDALLAAGADVHAIDDLEWNALHHTVFSQPVTSDGAEQQMAAVRSLVKAGARVDVPTGDSANHRVYETPLDLAIRGPSPAVVAFLMTTEAWSTLSHSDRQARVVQSIKEKSWEALVIMVNHGAVEHCDEARLSSWLQQVPPESLAYRCLEDQALRAVMNSENTALSALPNRRRL